MKLSVLKKIFSVCIAVVLIYGIGQIVYCFVEYDNMLTALPLHTMIGLEAALFAAIILVLAVIYFIIKKFIKK